MNYDIFISLPDTNDILLINDIAVGEKHDYELRLIYKDSGIDQSADMNKTFTGKIDIINTKNTVDIEGTVANYATGDFVQSNSTKRVSNIFYDHENKIYKYKILGLEPDQHTITVRNNSTGTEVVKSSKEIEVLTGDTSSVSDNTITTDGVARNVILNVDANSDNYTINKIIPQDYKENTLAYAIMNNDAIKKNGRRETFTAPATTDEGLFSAPDDYGTSYYFRGAVENNFVTFAGLTWRIVRINGDGSVRLILEYPLHADEVYGTSVKDVYNPSSSDNAYVGYMYGLPGTTTHQNRCLVSENGSTVDKFSTYTTKETCEANNGKWTTNAYEATHANVTNSIMKNTVDKFYEDYLIDEEDYLADIVFCNDKTIATNVATSMNTGLGYGTNTTFYGGAGRNVYQANVEKLDTTLATPSFRCAVGAKEDFSRFTVSKGLTPSGLETNGDLTYPIALLTVDELVYAGMFKEDVGTAVTYLENTYGTPGNYTNALATMTPGYFDSSRGYGTILVQASPRKTFNNVQPNKDATARPVINIKADVLVAGGYGTSGSPYTLKLK